MPQKVKSSRKVEGFIRENELFQTTQTIIRETKGRNQSQGEVD